MVTPPYNDQEDRYYSNAPRHIIRQLEKLNDSATYLTRWFVGCCLLGFIGLPVVMVFCVIRLYQSKKLLMEFPWLEDPYGRFPNEKRKGVRELAERHRNLREVVQFKDAQIAFWVLFTLPMALVVFLLLAYETI